MPEVEWSEQAEADLEGIAFYIGIENQNPKAADRILDQLRAKAKAYGRQPGMGTIYEEIEIPGDAGPVRSFRVKNYVAVYLETADGILVLRVVHGRRDLPSLF